MLGQTNTKTENCLALSKRRRLSSLKKKKQKRMGCYIEEYFLMACFNDENFAKIVETM